MSPPPAQHILLCQWHDQLSIDPHETLHEHSCQLTVYF